MQIREVAQRIPSQLRAVGQETRRVGSRAITLSAVNHIKILFVNVLVTAGLGGLGYWLGLVTPEFVGFLLLQFVLFQSGVWVYRVYVEDAPEATQRVVSWLALGGLVSLIALATVAAVWRVTSGVGYLAIAGALILLLFVLWDWFPRRSEALRGTQIGAVLLGIPFLAAWVLVSTYWLVARPGAPLPGAAALDTERVQREARRTLAPGVTVAVTLSGGGYRAAAFHAGVLQALEAAQVPIDYLSTVSGGSIIGAYYALGHSPASFLQRLARPPRLPNDLFALGAVLGHLVWPSYGSGDTYAAHFDRVLFGGRTVTPATRPILLVNVTEYESGHRKVFASQPGTRFADVSGLPVARLVAASGAFPGAFSPVNILGTRFMDGGARENLGVEGLRIYLSLNYPDLPLPKILIISNASQMLEVKDRPPNKIWRGDTLLRAYGTTYEEVHNQIFRHYLADRYFPGWPHVKQPVAGSAETLFGPWAAAAGDVYVFALTLHPGEAPYTGATGQHAAGNASCRSLEAIRAAQELETLAELDQDTLNQVACVGTWLMERWVKSVRCLIGALRDGLREPLKRCPPGLGGG